MNKISKITILAIILTLVSSCGVQKHNSINTNQSSTTVELSRKNFKVIQKVTGSSTASYFIGFGGLHNKNLLELAKNEMYSNANLAGTSRAIINMTTEEHVSIVFFTVTKTVFVSGYVIEFIN